MQYTIEIGVRVSIIDSESFSKRSPVKIPENAKIKVQSKPAGYEQISYNWRDTNYKYEIRWHIRTPGAPEGLGNTWVIRRTIPGTGGNTKPANHYLLDDNTWVTEGEWRNAIKARKYGIPTLRESGFYEGFEGEEVIDLIYKKDGEEIRRLEIWEEYFSTLLNEMITEETEAEGLLYVYSVYEGWYEDENLWKIPDITQAITQFKNYEKKLMINKKEIYKIWPEIPKILERILKFLEEARKNNGEVGMATKI